MRDADLETEKSEVHEGKTHAKTETNTAKRTKEQPQAVDPRRFHAAFGIAPPEEPEFFGVAECCGTPPEQPERGALKKGDRGENLSRNALRGGKSEWRGWHNVQNALRKNPKPHIVMPNFAYVYPIIWGDPTNGIPHQPLGGYLQLDCNTHRQDVISWLKDWNADVSWCEQGVPPTPEQLNPAYVPKYPKRIPREAAEETL